MITTIFESIHYQIFYQRHLYKDVILKIDDAEINNDGYDFFFA